MDGDGGGLAEAGRLLRAVDRILAAVIAVLSRVDRAQVIAAEGLTVESWLRAFAARTGADAGMLVLAAERLADMPATLAALRAGALSWGIVRGVVTAARPLMSAQRRWVDATVAGDRARLGRVDGDTVLADAEHAAARARPDPDRPSPDPCPRAHDHHAAAARERTRDQGLPPRAARRPCRRTARARMPARGAGRRVVGARWARAPALQMGQGSTLLACTSPRPGPRTAPT